MRNSKKEVYTLSVRSGNVQRSPTHVHMEGINVFFCNPPAGGVRTYLCMSSLAYGDQRRLLYRGFRQCHRVCQRAYPFNQPYQNYTQSLPYTCVHTDCKLPSSVQQEKISCTSNCRIGIGKGVRVKARLFLCTATAKCERRAATTLVEESSNSLFQNSRVGRDGGGNLL